MSDTPETDAAELIYDGIVASAYADVDVCRKLERERDDARAEVARLKTISVCELGSHNDNVREYIAHWEGRALKAERERDEAREALDCLLAVIGLTPIAGNKHALQDAVDHGLAVLRKQQEAGE